ncbi:MAG: hypothetical protein HY064_07855 [Bacteroidetes bacterium]|nr:hypothetical protein [Bacteroidota bacterium]
MKRFAFFFLVFSFFTAKAQLNLAPLVISTGNAADTSSFSIAVFNPQQKNVNDIVAYRHEKFELGIELPPDLFRDVESFCDQNTNDPSAVNPFDPEQLNVYAEFTSLSSGQNVGHAQKIFGFYYREFMRNETGEHKAWDYSASPTNYTFRFRFAPPDTGRWKTIIKIESAKHGNYSSHEIDFNCLLSSDIHNEGNIHTLPGKRYLELGNHMFMPIGWNITNPIPRSFSDYRFGYGPYDGWKTINMYGYIDFGNYLSELSFAGGNFFRMHDLPWSTEIEFEKLNDYSGRLSNAWEMDRILDEAKDLDLYILLSLDVANKLLNGAGAYWDWAGNDLSSCAKSNGGPDDNGLCYHSQLGLKDPVDFLSDAQAKKYYKYRLRYMISRYAYSRNIAMFELCNEANTIGKEFSCDKDCAASLIKDPYNTSASFRAILQKWQTEMTDYLKHDLDLQDHLLTINYAGEPNKDDLSFTTCSIDVNDYNYYSEYISRTGNYFYIQKRSGIGSALSRPVFFSETGSPERDECSDFAEWVRTFWTIPFSGCAGGLNWPKTSLPDLPAPYYAHFARLRDFLSGVDFNDGDWDPEYQLQSDLLAETMYLKHLTKGHANKAIGVVLNRCYNDNSMRTCDNCDCSNYRRLNGVKQKIYPDSVPFDPPKDVSYRTGPGKKMKVTGMGSHKHYKVEWTDVMTGKVIETDSEYTQLDGDLLLQYPALIMTTKPVRPILAFKVFP